MLRTVKAAVLPIIYANVDLWKSKFSGDKFLRKTMLEVYCVDIPILRVCGLSPPLGAPQIYIHEESGGEQRRVN